MKETKCCVTNAFEFEAQNLPFRLAAAIGAV